MKFWPYAGKTEKFRRNILKSGSNWAETMRSLEDSCLQNSSWQVHAEQFLQVSKVEIGIEEK